MRSGVALSQLEQEQAALRAQRDAADAASSSSSSSSVVELVLFAFPPMSVFP